MYANYYGRSKHSKVGIFNDENVIRVNFIKIFEDACIYKKVSGSAETYFKYFMYMAYRLLEIMCFS
jgi:hypothetical protein